MSIKIRRIDGGPLGALETFNLGGEPAALEADGTLTMLNVLDYTLRDLIKDTPFEEVPAPVSPDSLTGLHAWYKADALSLADEADITQWADSSGNLRTLTPNVAGQFPTFDTNQQNGLPGARFDGAEDFRNTHGAHANYTWLVVAKADAAIVDGKVAVQKGHPYAHLRVDTVSDRWEWPRLNGNVNMTIPDSNIHAAQAIGVKIATAGDLTRTINFYVNGEHKLGPHSPDPLSTSQTVFMLGAAAFAGHIFEIAVYSRALTDDEMAGVSNYLVAKWGL
jgi:hypothetical protein